MKLKKSTTRTRKALRQLLENPTESSTKKPIQSAKTRKNLSETLVNVKNHPVRTRSSGWFCTWPKCNLSPGEALETLKKRFGDVLLEHVIAREGHADGGYHLHAFLKFSVAFPFAKDLFDLSGSHGNYQVARSWEAVKVYVSKGGDFVSSFDTAVALRKKGKLDFQVLRGGVRAALAAAEENRLSPLSYRQLRKAQQQYEQDLTLIRLLDGRTPALPEWREKGDNQWWAGEPNTGKSKARKALVELFGPDMVFEIPSNNDWTGYEGQVILYLPEYDGRSPTVVELCRICDGQAKVNTKGGTVTLCRQPIVIVDTNLNLLTKPRNLSTVRWKALLARFNVIWLRPGREARFQLLNLYATVSRQIFRLVLHMQREAELYKTKVDNHERALEALPKILQMFSTALSVIDKRKATVWLKGPELRRNKSLNEAYVRDLNQTIEGLIQGPQEAFKVKK